MNRRIIDDLRLPVRQKVSIPPVRRDKRPIFAILRLTTHTILTFLSPICPIRPLRPISPIGSICPMGLILFPPLLPRSGFPPPSVRTTHTPIDRSPDPSQQSASPTSPSHPVSSLPAIACSSPASFLQD
jgi:hypothetical protein